MQHDRTMRLTIRTNVLQLETLGQIEIDLSRAALPPATDRVPDFEINFRSVKCAATFIHFICNAAFDHACAQSFGSLLPNFITADSFLRLCRKKRLDFFETERMPQGVSKIDQIIDFRFE